MTPRTRRSVASGWFSGCLVWIVLIGALSLTACDDPSDAGLGLVDQQAGEPVVADVLATSVQVSDRSDFTGGDAFGGAVYSLAGNVEDPLFGALIATGYVDFLPLQAGSSSYRSSSVTYAQLTLSIAYVYGDTTGPITYELYDMNEEWSINGRRADTTLTSGNFVTGFTVNPTDERAVVQLPNTWFRTQGPNLRRSDFENAFHGFEIRPVNGNAVLGFESPDSELLVGTASGDTARFQVSKRLSSITRDEPRAPAGTFLFQDGVDAEVVLRFPFTTGEVSERAVHRAAMRLNRAAAQMPDAPAGFVRPPVTRVGLRAVATDDAASLTLTTVDIVDGQISFDSEVLADIIQAAILGTSTLYRFELFIPTASAGIGVLLLNDLQAASQRPRTQLTYTPLN